MTTDHDHTTDHENALLITVREDDDSVYGEGRTAIEMLDRGEPVEQPDSVTFPNEAMLARTFTEQTLGLLRVITDEEPESIRETARLVERDVKNVHEELTRFEAMGVIRFAEEGRSKRPVFPYDELIITVPFGHRSGSETDQKLATDGGRVEKTENPVNWLVLTFPTGERFGVPARIVAEHRANHDTDEGTLADWARENMDWEELRPYAERLDSPERDLGEFWNDAEFALKPASEVEYD